MDQGVPQGWILSPLKKHSNCAILTVTVLNSGAVVQFWNHSRFSSAYSPPESPV